MKRQWLILTATVAMVFGTFVPVLADVPEAQKGEALTFRRKLVCLADRVVIGNSTLYELDKSSGRVLRKLVLGSPICSDPLVVTGNIYVVTTDGVIRAAKDAKEIWKTRLPDTTSFSTDHRCDVVAFADYLCISGPDAMTCLRRSTGEMLWKQDAPGEVRISAGRLYAAGKSHAICAVDLSTGKTLWKEQGEFSDSGPILIQDGALYVSHGSDGVFSKLDLSTGKLSGRKWTEIIISGGGRSSPCLAGR